MIRFMTWNIGPWKFRYNPETGVISMVSASLNGTGFIGTIAQHMTDIQKVRESVQLATLCSEDKILMKWIIRDQLRISYLGKTYTRSRLNLNPRFGGAVLLYVEQCLGYRAKDEQVAIINKLWSESQ